MIPDDFFDVLNRLFPSCFQDIHFDTLFQNRRNKIVLIDVDCCISRLYGGKYMDWTCGGQWNEMLLSHLGLIRQVSDHLNIEFVFFFDGCADLSRYHEWSSNNKSHSEHVRRIWTHIHRKATPPPRAWFVPPLTVRRSLKGALRLFGFHTITSAFNHRHEMMEFLLSQPVTALVSSDKYFLFNSQVPNSVAFLWGTQFRLDRDSGLIRCSKVCPIQLKKKMGLKHPQAHALLALSGNHILTLSEIQAIVDSKYLKKNAEKSSSELYISGLIEFLQKVGAEDTVSKIAAVMKTYWPESEERSSKFKAAYYYFRHRIPTKASLIGSSNGSVNESKNVSASKTKAELKKERGFLLYTDMLSDWSAKIPTVKLDLINVAHMRHVNGQLHPWILPLLTSGEVIFQTGLEEQVNRQFLIRSLEVTRPLRQILYGIIFSLSDIIQKSYRKNVEPEPILIREWYPRRSKPEFVQALPFRNWKSPDLRLLWLSQKPVDYNKRVRTFIATFLSDTPFLAEVQPRLVVPCLVLRYLHQQPSSMLRVLDINVFLAVALSPELNNIGYTSKLDPCLTQRGVALSTMFLRCVEHACFANDVCGQPLPPQYVHPWNYFDGKLFQHKMALASRSGANLLSFCSEDPGMLPVLDSLRAAILQGTQTTRVHIKK